ncbi:MAG: undecaprenyldiphospho-muramoylpentapeptide beta-N-acetylglucosaminyltransferase [Burkholderiaceae bacterium]
MTHTENRRLVIAAGGTGGHVFPALAVAQALQRQGVVVEWVGSNRGLEARVVRDQAGFALTELTVQGLRGRGLAGLLGLPLGLMRSLIDCWRVLARVRPGLVLVFGGYVSFPVGLAARLQGRPLWVHEQNAVMGTANRWLARLAERVFTSFPVTQHAPASAVCVGNPVRESLTDLPPASARPMGEAQPLRLLVLGGSLGARALNHALPLVVSDLQRRWPGGLAVWHQTGTAEEAAVRQAYAAQPVAPQPLRVNAFIDDMASAYQWADLVVCRAGASTVAELATVGLPAIFVPLPNAIDDHQTANARALVQAGAALLVAQTDRLADALSVSLSGLTAERLRSMAQATQALGARHALSRFLQQVQTIWPLSDAAHPAPGRGEGVSHET